MTPDQIALVEATVATLDLDALTADFYERALAEEPALSAMFTSDPATQRARFAAELAEILGSIRSLDSVGPNARALGSRHRSYGVRVTHYRLMGRALLGALACALGTRWSSDTEAAWTMAYNLTAEMMMAGAREHGAVGTPQSWHPDLRSSGRGVPLLGQDSPGRGDAPSG